MNTNIFKQKTISSNMITKEKLKEIIKSQIHKEPQLIHRELQLPKTQKATIITGIRRSGKSTLLRQQFPKALAINFEDPRLTQITPQDLFLLEELTNEPIILDEVQNILGWEEYVRSAVDRKKQVYITGSNATMLSRELGTKLTGRHTSIELFPFSYQEYITYTKQKPGKASLIKYLKQGGFPEYLREQNDQYLRELLSDIVIRDVAVRNNIKNEQTLIQLTVYLLSNIGKPLSYNKISRTLHIKSVRTTIDYIDYLQQSYIIHTIPQYATSIHKQLNNPKKVYATDNGLVKANSMSFSEDQGRILENTIFMQLRRTHKEIHHHQNDETECDFLVKEKNTITQAIQVTTHLNDENTKREVQGLVQALKETKAPTGIIITLDQEDKIIHEGHTITVIPAWKWLLQQTHNN